VSAAVLALALAAASPPRTTALSRPALDELAWRIVEQVEASKPEPPYGVWVDGAPAPLVRAFASALSSQLAARKKGPSVIDVPTAAEAEALARAHDLRTLLRLTVQLDGQKLLARGDAINTWVNFWSGATPTRPQQWAALTASADADPQALALGAAVAAPNATGPLKLTLTSFAKLPSQPAALAFGDLDGDGKGDLAVLLEEGVSVFGVDGRLEWKSDLRELPAAPSPSREPFGALGVAQAPARLLLSSSRKAKTATLVVARGGRLETQASDAAVPIDGVAVKPAAGTNVFERQVSIGARGLELPAPFTAISSRGNVTLVVYPDGTAMLVDGGVPATRFTGVGAASALADLDGDGTPELLVSSTRYAVDGDPLVVLSLSQALALQAKSSSTVEASTLWQGSTPRGRAITALGADLDGDRVDEVVLGVWLPDGTGELLVGRAK
jgi:hypothetical protein